MTHFNDFLKFNLHKNTVLYSLEGKKINKSDKYFTKSSNDSIKLFYYCLEIFLLILFLRDNM